MKAKPIKKYFRIFNTLTKRYVRAENGGFLVLEYARQCEEFIDRRLKGSRVYKIIEWRKRK